MNFWDFSSWGFFNLMAILLASLLGANMLKRSSRKLEESLIPTSVLGGGILLVISAVYKAITGIEMFDTSFFAVSGPQTDVLHTQFLHHFQLHIQLGINLIGEAGDDNVLNHGNRSPSYFRFPQKTRDVFMQIVQLHKER